MSYRIVPVTAQALRGIPVPCAGCAFWESATGPVPRHRRPICQADADADASVAVAKDQWLTETASAWGTCGWVAEVDDRPAGYVLYAPPGYVPRAAAFPTAPPSRDAVLLLTVQVVPHERGNGLGRALVRAVAADLVGRGVRALEAYASPAQVGCLLSVDFLAAVGFCPVREHAVYPRMRLDLRSTVTWREDVEGVWARLVRGYFGTRSGSRIDPVGASSSSGR